MLSYQALLFRKCHLSHLKKNLWPRLTACGVLVPQPGMEPTPPAVEAWSLNPWTAREVPQLSHFIAEETGSELEGGAKSVLSRSWNFKPCCLFCDPCAQLHEISRLAKIKKNDNIHFRKATGGR